MKYLLVLVLLVGCTGDAAFDAAAQELHSRTVAAMSADGVESPTKADWVKYGSQAMAAMQEETEGPPPVVPWWVTLGDFLAAFLVGGGTYKAGTIGLQALYATFTGKHTRATENLAGILSPTVSAKETLKRVAALALDTHSPKTSDG